MGRRWKPPRAPRVLEAATAAGVRIPTLCYLKDLNCIGSCRACLVDVEGEGLAASCNTAVRRGHGGAHRHAAGSSGPTGESAGHHGRSPRALRHLRAPGHLRPARPCEHLQPDRTPPRSLARAGALGRRLPAAARQQQVHQVHALRGHLREGAALRRVGLHWASALPRRSSCATTCPSPRPGAPCAASASPIAPPGRSHGP